MRRQPSPSRRSPRTGASTCGSRAAGEPPRRAGPSRPAARRRRGRRCGHGSGLLEQRAAPRHGEQLGHGGGRGDPSGPTGVHAAEQGLDQPLHDLVAQPRGDQVADRDVVVDGGDHPLAQARARPSGRARRSRPARRRRTALPSGDRGIGAARRGTRSARWRTSGAPRRDRARAPAHALGAAVEHRLGADVDDRPRPPTPSRSLPPISGDPSSTSTSRPARPGHGRRSGRRSRHRPPRRRTITLPRGAGSGTIRSRRTTQGNRGRRRRRPTAMTTHPRSPATPAAAPPAWAWRPRSR